MELQQIVLKNYEMLLFDPLITDSMGNTLIKAIENNPDFDKIHLMEVLQLYMR